MGQQKISLVKIKQIVTSLFKCIKFHQIKIKMKFSKKSLGQNFLIDKNIVKKIINLTKLKS